MPTLNPKQALDGNVSPTAFDIFTSFLKIGMTAFGGPAMAIYIKAMVVDKKKWLDEETFRQGVALCQTLPGAIAVNVASYAGYRTLGLPGMIAAFAGFTLPAFLLMFVFSVLYIRTRSLPVMSSLFSGLEIIVVSIVFHAAATFGRKALCHPGDFILFAIGALLLFFKINPFVVIVIVALTGIFIYRWIGAESTPEARQPAGTKRDLFLIAAFFAVGLAVLWIFSRKLFDLAWVMAKIELFAFGGGYTALTLMFHEVVGVHRWLDHQTLMDGVALGQITPGPILITAAFIGYIIGDFAGALVGTIAIFTPGMFLIVAILPLFDRLRSSSLFLRAIRGTISCFVALLLYVALKFAFAVHWDVKHFLFLAGSLGGLLAGIDILYVVFAGAVAAVLFL
ncbi:MAG: chromate efflux transporter [Nitrospirae bacterium]|nr:chromate efflux transporter [Nitrospirota bacterium]